MSTEIQSGDPEPLPTRDDELEDVADTLRRIADRVDPRDDWMHDRWGNPL